jgi:hypothetical protein
MNLTERLGERIDKQHWLKEIQNNPEYQDQLFSIATGTLKPQAWRATWLIRQALPKEKLRLLIKPDAVIGVVSKREEGHQRELLKLIEPLPLTEEQESSLFDTCLSIWEEIAKTPSVRITAFKTMLNIAKKYPELKNELSFLVQDHYTESLSPGIKASLEKTIRQHL